MESECEGCGEKSGPLGGTWHNLCFACVGKMKVKVERLEKAAEKQITRACVNAVEKLNEIAPEHGWDSGETVAEMYIQVMKRDAALEGGKQDG